MLGSKFSWTTYLCYGDRVVQSWCYLREQEDVGMDVTSFGLNKHCRVWCGIQLSEWVPKDWVQLPRRMRKTTAAKPWLMEMWTKDGAEQPLPTLPWGTFPWCSWYLLRALSSMACVESSTLGRILFFTVFFSFSFLLADLGLCFQIKHQYSTHVRGSAFQGTQRERKLSIK